ncbi:MAG: glycoside hydrolase family 97 N-terminal domain-containing protein, partial [Ignavibacterium sp.]
MIKYLFLLSVSLAVLFSCSQIKNQYEVFSKDNKIEVKFLLNNSGQANYIINFDGKRVIDTSSFSFDFKDGKSFGANLEIVDATQSSFDKTWETVWGEQKYIRNNYNELIVEVREKEDMGRKCTVVFRVFNDGVGFRFEFPDQENMKDVVIVDENTQFNLTGNHKCWWIPGDWDIYEHLFNTTRFTEIDAMSKRNHPSLAQTYIPENAVNTPVTMKANDGIYLSIL